MSKWPPLTEHELVFPSASVNVNAIARRINNASTSQSILARLRSINEDTNFVHFVANDIKLPVIANERCGSWYVPPKLKAGSVYFKSTDGHVGQWAFSLRRLNLQLLDILSKHDGCIIVDSTRRGKHAPDALAKTIPIWCAVLSLLVFPDAQDSAIVRLHPHLTSDSERAQIAVRIKHLVEQARQVVDLNSLQNRMSKPLKPRWIVRSLPESGALSSDSSDSRSTKFHHIYLCMASEYSESSSADNYVQGAGDDSESWARGLTPELFWENHDELLSSADVDLPHLIAGLVPPRDSASFSDLDVVTLSSIPQLSLAPLNRAQNIPQQSAKIFVCTEKPWASHGVSSSKLILHLECSSGKLGSRNLRSELHKVPDFVEHLNANTPIAILCSTGKDLSVGVALVLTVLYSDERGNIFHSRQPKSVDKAFVKRKLATIVAAMPQANPSRATLNAVNSFLMSAASR